MVFDAIERLKHRIHSIRIPIRNKKLLFAVQCGYFISPVVVGYFFMQWVIPSPESMRQQITPPSPEALAAIEQEKRRLQAELDNARRKRANPT